MPGPVSDAYDPEWGTRANGAEISEALKDMYEMVGGILDDVEPVFILDVVRKEFDNPSDLTTATLTTRQWRLLRFALERAIESI